MEFTYVDIKNNGSTFDARLNLPPHNSDRESDVFSMLNDDAVKLELRSWTVSNTIHVLIFVKFTKSKENDEHTYTMQVIEPSLNTTILTGELWQFIWEVERSIFPFRVILTVHQVKKAAAPPMPVSFAALNEDTELTDFEMRAQDGAVCVHRTALAAASPVLHRLVTSDCREAKQAFVEFNDFHITTLRHLKAYIYLNVLPECCVQDLLRFAHRYMMGNLEKWCTKQLLEQMSQENVIDLIEFASKHQLKNLLISVLERVKDEDINIEKMRECLKICNQEDVTDK